VSWVALQIHHASRIGGQVKPPDAATSSPAPCRCHPTPELHSVRGLGGIRDVAAIRVRAMLRHQRRQRVHRLRKSTGCAAITTLRSPAARSPRLAAPQHRRKRRRITLARPGCAPRSPRSRSSRELACGEAISRSLVCAGARRPGSPAVVGLPSEAISTGTNRAR